MELFMQNSIAHADLVEIVNLLVISDGRHKLLSPLARIHAFINPLQPSRLANGAANKEHCRISSKVLFRFHVNPIPVAAMHAKWVINLPLSRFVALYRAAPKIHGNWHVNETTFTISIKIDSVIAHTRCVILELLLFDVDYHLNWNVRTEITKRRDKDPIERTSIIITIIIRWMNELRLLSTRNTCGNFFLHSSSRGWL